MRKIFYFMTVFAAMLTFSACSDSDDLSDNAGDGGSAVVTPKDDYTIIFWGMSDNTEPITYLDFDDMLRMRMRCEIDSNVNFIGLLKCGKKFYQKIPDLAEYNYTQLIDLPAKPDYDTTKVVTSENMDVNDVNNIYKALNVTKYADSNYPLYNPDSLASFIKMAAAKYPAKHYILMTYGHGSGFNPTEEEAVPSAYTTRSCVIDSWTAKNLTADNLVAGIQRSGIEIQTIFFQNCLMATLENLAAYQHCAKYAFASAEETSGGYLQKFMANISQAGPDETKMVQAARKTVDQYAKKNENSDIATSHGFYDLTKTPELLNTVKEISAWFENAAETDTAFVNAVALSAVNSCEYYSMTESEQLNTIRENVQTLLSKDDKLTLEEIDYLIDNLTSIADEDVVFGTVFADFVYAGLKYKDAAKSGKLDFDKLQSLFNQYITQLKDMAYINGNMQYDEENYFYILASPTINVFTMNKEKFQPTGIWKYGTNGDNTLGEKLLTLKLALYYAQETGQEEKLDSIFNEYFLGTYFARVKAPETLEQRLATVTTNYTSSQFDQTCHWSNFLKKLQTNPTFIVTPGRREFYLKLMQQNSGK